MGSSYHWLGSSCASCACTSACCLGITVAVAITLAIATCSVVSDMIPKKPCFPCHLLAECCINKTHNMGQTQCQLTANSHKILNDQMKCLPGTSNNIAYNYTKF